MELQKTKHQIKLEQWCSRVLDCRSRGMTVKAWCATEGVSTQTYYYWQKLVWEAETSNVHTTALQNTTERQSPLTFAEYKPPVTEIQSTSTAALVLHLSCGSLEIQNGAEQAVIENTLAALKKLC